MGWGWELQDLLLQGGGPSKVKPAARSGPPCLGPQISGSYTFSQTVGGGQPPGSPLARILDFNIFERRKNVRRKNHGAREKEGPSEGA